MRHIAARWFTLIAVMFALSFVAGSAFAQDDDPPNRAARLSYASGSVSFEPAGTDDWVDAVINRPLTSGDKLWADQDGRAELRMDSYALRLGPQTGFSFLNLDDNVVQVRLTEGSLNIRVRRLDENQTLEIDTPNLAFNVLRPGSYRIDVNENGDATLVTVREGQGEVTGGGSAYPIRAGDSVNFSGVDQLNADVEGIGDGDDFDQWSNSRDQRWEHSTSARYVSDDAVGYEDLDENGQWDSDPEYGTVWYPRSVAADWAPYRYGHWVWVSPWGWTWVDDASWGFAPFHYGRWVVARGRWCWVPSPPRPAYVTREYVRPVYAPALVAWVGGPRFGVGVAVGGAAAGVAWFPLGPRDVYTPSYHVSQRYVERVNVSNTRIVNRTQVTNVYNTVYVNKTVNVTNITYQNQRANNSVTATSQASFTTAQPVGRNQVRVDARQMAAAPVTPLASVAPQQRSFAGAGGAAKAHPPANFASRNVVAKTAPPPAPVPVAQQMKAVQANGGRPVAAAQVRANQPEPARANVKVAAPAKVAALPPKGNSVNRPGQPVRPAQANQQNQPATAQPNANRPANVNPNPPNANANRPNPGQPNASSPNAGNPNQPNPGRPNPNAPNANANRPNPDQPNANPANANRPNTPSAENPNRPAPNQPNANPNAPNANRPNAENPNRPNPNPPAANPPNANRPNANPNTPSAENPNRPAPNQPNANPNAPNANRPNAANPNRPNPNPPAANAPNANRPNANPNTPNAENPNRPKPNRPPTATPNNPNANPPVDNRPATNDRPPAARQNTEPQTQQRQQQQERQNAEQQRAQQQQRLEQQRADVEKRQDVQRQQQQQQQKEAAKPQPKEQQPPREAAKPQPKEQQPPPKKDNKDNKEKDKKDRPPSR